MAEDFGFYFANVDNVFGSIFVDMQYGGGGPDAARPTMVWFRLKMRAPRPDGLSSDEESETLFAIGDALVDRVAQVGGIFAGRATHGGLRDFYFYVPADAERDAQRALRAAIAGFPEYLFDLGSQHEPQWTTYFSFLYPDPASRQQMADNTVWSTMLQAGDDPDKQRAVRYWTYFVTQADADGFAVWATSNGFDVAAIDPAEAEIAVQLVKVQSLRDALESSAQLFTEALNHAGRYDGWEAPVTP